MSGPIGEAFVAIRPDTSGFSPAAERGVNAALDSIDKTADRVGQQVSARFEGTFEQLAGHAASAGERVEGSMTEVGDRIAHELAQGAERADAAINERFRDARGRFLPLGTSAERAAEVIEHQMKEGASKADKALASIDGDGFHRARDGIKSLLAAAGGFYALVTLKDKLKEASQEGAESAKISRVTATLVDTTGKAANLTADQVGAIATNLSQLTGIDDEAIQAGENVLLTFKNVKDGVGPYDKIFSRATTSAANLSTVLGGDLSGANVLLGKALNDPVKGIAALGRAGVQFTAEQKAQIKTMVESGNVLGAQKIILAEVEGQVGGAAIAAATPMERLKVATDNLKESLGTGLNAAIGPLVTSLGDVATGLEPLFGAIGSGLGETLAAIGPVLGQLAKAVAPVLVSLAPLLGAALGTAGKLILSVMQALAPVIETLAPPLGEIIGLIGGAFGEVIRQVAPVVAQLATALAPVIKMLGGTFATVIRAVAPLIGKLAGVLGPIVGLLADGLAKALIIVSPLIGDLASFLTLLVDQLGGALGDALKTVMPALLDVVGVLVDSLRPVLPLIADALGQVIAALADGLADVLVQLAPMLPDLVRSIVELNVALIPLLPPLAKLIAFAIRLVGAGLGAVLEALAPVIVKVADGMTAVAEAIARIDWDKVGEGAKNVATAVLGFFQDLPGNVVSFFVDLPGRIVSFFAPIPGQIASALGGLALSLVTAVGGALGNLLTSLPGLTIDLLSFFAIKLPLQIAYGVVGLGALLVEQLGRAFIAVVTALPGMIVSTVQFFAGLPARFAGLVVDVGPKVASAIGTGLTTAAGAVERGMTTILEGIASLPGRIIALAPKLLDAAKELGSTLVRGLGRGVSAVVSGALDLAGAVARAVRTVMNKIVDELNDAFDFTLKGPGPLPDLHVNLPDIPRFAAGTIADRPTLGIFGEAGREVVINTEGDPARARALAARSGLLDLLAQGLDPGPTVAAAATPQVVDRSINLHGPVVLRERTVLPNVTEVLRRVRRAEDLGGDDE